MDLAAVVLAQRSRQGLTRQELARLAGISYPYLSQIETGDRVPSLKTLAKLAQALALPLEDLASAAPKAVSGVRADSLTSLGAMTTPSASERIAGRRASAVRRAAQDLPPWERIEVLTELLGEAVREARGPS